ncbi:protein-export chaperone SecB [Desulfopila inferna]|uniref:protein-export chaperone SecB n=1 Tax=Desulfopila inferna TaxID=468528 RepID=UPI0019660DD1|nr:protein-export chaperone SecB [Desulfopila inferna]MBM9606215.1 protein-export chaperone SecB [Desulfopila inferna]
MAENNKEKKQGSPEFRMQKMYIKDLSFENPNAPEIYMTQSEKAPEVDVNLQLNHKQVNEDHYEVCLEITAKIVNKELEKTLFILELEHAAVFMLKNIPEEHLKMVLAVDCPTLLFPFTRQIASQVSVDGGFVPFLMEPINFMGLYQNSLKKQEKEGKSN